MPIGLAKEEKAEKYLKQAYGLTKSDAVSGIPIFSNDRGEYFVGGYKNFYTLLEDDAGSETVLKALERWRHDKKNVRYVFSMKQDHFKSKRLDLILEIPIGTTKENRLVLYDYNVKKHIRRVAGSPLKYSVESVSDKVENASNKLGTEWYELYVNSIQRLNGKPRTQDWFRALEDNFNDNAILVTARDGDKLVGGLYCLVAENYVNLLFIASEKEYWDMRVNNGLYDSAICYAIENGVRFVDFGPTMASDEGHWKIKTAFGATKYYFADVSFTSTYQRLKNALKDVTSRILKRLSRITLFKGL